MRKKLRNLVLKRNPSRCPSREIKRRHEHRNGTKPPVGIRVVGTPPTGAMAQLRAARISAINHPGRDGAGFLDEAVHLERRIAEGVEFQVRP